MLATQNISYILLLKVFLGARNSDVTSILALNGVRKDARGYRLRLYDSKAKANKFSQGVNFNYLVPELKSLCIASCLDELFPVLH